MVDNEVLFKGTVERAIYDTEDYKIYAINVDRNKYPDIKFTKYGNASITGELHSLGIGIEYEIKAIEQHNKNGYSYKVINIRRDRPSNAYDMSVFHIQFL